MSRRAVELCLFSLTISLTMTLTTHDTPGSIRFNLSRRLRDCAMIMILTARTRYATKTAEQDADERNREEEQEIHVQKS